VQVYLLVQGKELCLHNRGPRSSQSINTLSLVRNEYYSQHPLLHAVTNLPLCTPSTMAKLSSSVPRLALSVRGALRPIQRNHARCFSAATRYRTDGVYRELTAMRTRTPFIEAFRKQQEDANGSKPVSTEKVERDMSPKTMSDSFHRVVSHMTGSTLYCF
jgi:hypothetical protein